MDNKARIIIEYDWNKKISEWDLIQEALKVFWRGFHHGESDNSKWIIKYFELNPKRKIKTFKATTEEIHVWECPHCKETNRENFDPDDKEVETCGFCGKESQCEGVDDGTGFLE